MERNKYITVFALLNTLACSMAKASAEAGQQHRERAVRSGQANPQMSAKAVVNTNAQWSADPERGWVRADERHQLHNQNQSMKNKKKVGKSKSTGSRGAKQ